MTDRAGLWRRSILWSAQGTRENDRFRRELMWLFTSLYTSRKPGYADFQVREAFVKRQIPLPESIHEFLYGDPPPAVSVRSFLKHPRAALRQWAQRRAGRHASDYFRRIDEVLTYMETQMEMKHDDNPDM